MMRWAGLPYGRQQRRDALATTEVVEAVPDVLSTNIDILRSAVHRYHSDTDEAAETGKAARDGVLRRYGLKRFLDDWDRVLWEATR